MLDIIRDRLFITYSNSISNSSSGCSISDSSSLDYRLFSSIFSRVYLRLHYIKTTDIYIYLYISMIVVYDFDRPIFK
jgi:hypothetical protein